MIYRVMGYSGMLLMVAGISLGFGHEAGLFWGGVGLVVSAAYEYVLADNKASAARDAARKAEWDRPGSNRPVSF